MWWNPFFLPSVLQSAVWWSWTVVATSGGTLPQILFLTPETLSAPLIDLQMEQGVCECARNHFVQSGFDRDGIDINERHK